MTDVTVVTITRSRSEVLHRAIRSVQQQDFPGSVEHLVIVDDCVATLDALQSLVGEVPGLRYIHMPRSACDKNGPRRLAWLRNFSAYQVTSPWMSFLDDDNEFEPEHLRVLHETAMAQSLDAVFSYDRIFNADGTPFLQKYWPWARTTEEASSLYDFYCGVGVLTPGSNIQRHRIQTEAGKPRVLWVDTNVWLFKREILRRVPIPLDYSDEDWCNIITEDDKMLAGFVESGVRIGCTQRPTVRYYLGGYSNRFDGSAGTAHEVWHREENASS